MLFKTVLLCFLGIDASIIVHNNNLHEKSSNHSAHVRQFFRFAINEGANYSQPSDKFTDHSYHTMYGIFLWPLLRDAVAANSKIKLLEIGLGCDMKYGPGKSAHLWKSFFGKVGEIWFAEYNELCVEQELQYGRLNGLNIITGDQSNQTTLIKWVKETSGNFDVIIDDGGHTNHQIKSSFDVLFESALSPGGLYFIEDMQVGRSNFFGFEDPVMADVIESWIDQLLINPTDPRLNDRKTSNNTRHMIPKNIKWIFCQSEACVIAKCALNDVSRCS